MSNSVCSELPNSQILLTPKPASGKDINLLRMISMNCQVQHLNYIYFQEPSIIINYKIRKLFDTSLNESFGKIHLHEDV